MSVTVLPYLADVSAASSAPSSVKQPTGKTNTNFKDVLDAATSAQQKMAVDALIAASGSGTVSVSTVQKILGFNPQYTGMENIYLNTQSPPRRHLLQLHRRQRIQILHLRHPHHQRLHRHLRQPPVILTKILSAVLRNWNLILRKPPKNIT